MTNGEWSQTSQEWIQASDRDTCAEVSFRPEKVLIREAKFGRFGYALEFSNTDWFEFIEAVRKGHFDLKPAWPDSPL